MDKNLENRIQALEKWQKERTTQQISYPLDINSVKVLNQYFMQLTGTVRTVAGAGGNEFVFYVGSQNGTQFQFQVDANTFIPYTVDVTSNTLTESKVRFPNDTQVYVSTSDTPPAPLSTSTNYFVINSTGTTFKLSLTMGGVAINITDNGIGQQYIYFF